MNTQPILFDEASHTYTRPDDGSPRVGLTSLLRTYGFGVSKFYTDEGRELGKALHLACQLLAEGDLDWECVDPRIAAQVRGYQKFLDYTRFEPEHLEVPFYDEGVNIATKPDQIGSMNGRLAVVELKRGAPEKWHALQTAGQKIVVTNNGIDVVDRFALYLRPDDFRLIRHFDTSDEACFRNLALAYHDPEIAERFCTQLETIKLKYGGKS